MIHSSLHPPQLPLRKTKKDGTRGFPSMLVLCEHSRVSFLLLLGLGCGTVVEKSIPFQADIIHLRTGLKGADSSIIFLFPSTP